MIIRIVNILIIIIMCNTSIIINRIMFTILIAILLIRIMGVCVMITRRFIALYLTHDIRIMGVCIMITRGFIAHR